MDTGCGKGVNCGKGCRGAVRVAELEHDRLQNESVLGLRFSHATVSEGRGRREMEGRSHLGVGAMVLELVEVGGELAVGNIHDAHPDHIEQAVGRGVWKGGSAVEARAWTVWNIAPADDG